MSKNNEIQVEFLDENKMKEINSFIKNLKAIPGGSPLLLELRSTDGKVTDALDLVSNVHSDDLIDFHIGVSGTVGVAGTILTAGGKLGYREAKFGTKFQLSKNGPYAQETKASELSSDDRTNYNTLTALTKKGKLILQHIIEGNPISADEAKKCRIIDKVGKFESKYFKKKRFGKADPVGQNTHGNNVLPGNQIHQTPGNPPVNSIPPIQQIPPMNLNPSAPSNQVFQYSQEQQNLQSNQIPPFAQVYPQDNSLMQNIQNPYQLIPADQQLPIQQNPQVQQSPQTPVQPATKKGRPRKK